MKIIKVNRINKFLIPYLWSLVILVTVLFLLSDFAFAYKNLGKGTEFWFTYINRGFNGRVMICSEKPNSGTISMPHFNWSQSFKIDSNSCTSIVIPNLYYHLHYNRFTIEKNGIYLKTENPATVFSSEESNLGDHTIILPIYATGADYIISTYDIGTLRGDNNIDNAFFIVSGYDNNLIEITPRIRYLNVNDTVLPPYRLTLNKGETYLYSDSGDLTGSRVKCLDPSKPISVFAGNYNTIIDSTCSDPKEGNDPVWEQLYPLESMDNEFIFIPFKYLNNGNIARIIALENNTNISLNNRVVKTLNEKEYFDTLLFNPAIIKSNKKISVIQFSRNKDCLRPKVNRDFVGDPSMLSLLPAKAMFTGNITFKTVALGDMNIKKHCLNIITHSRNINKIYLDTLNIRSFFKPLPSNSNFYFAQIDIEEGVHNIYSSAMYLAYLYGFSGYGINYEWDGGYSLSLGFGANLTSFKLQPDNPVCAQTLIEFTAITPEEVKFWEWVIGDTVRLKGKKVNYEFREPGVYTVSLFSKLDSNDSDYWDMFQEEINVIPFIKPEIKTNPPNKKLICRGDNVELFLENKYFTYRWSTGESSPAITVRRGGIYIVIVTSNNGCIGKATIEIEEYKTQKPVIEIIGDNPFCEGDSVVLKTNLKFIKYRWSNGDTTETITLRKPANIYVTVIDSNGCSSSSDIIEIKGFSRPKPEIEGPDAVYSDFTARYKINTVKNTKIRWLASNGAIIGRDDLEEIDIKWINFGLGIVEVWQIDTITNCVGYDRLVVNIDSSLKPRITPSNKVLCEGSSIIISATAGFETYKWNTGETSREIIIKTPGIYYVSVTNKKGLIGYSDTLNIFMVKPPLPVITGQNKICNGENTELSCLQNFTKYFWNTGDTTKNIIIDKTGEYELTVLDSNNCVGKTIFKVELISSGLTGYSSYDFGYVILKHNKNAIFNLMNSGKNNIIIDNIAFKNIPNNAFRIINNFIFPLVLKQNEGIQLEVEFQPLIEKLYYDSLVVNISQPCRETITMIISGNGIDKVPVIFSLPDTTALVGNENFGIPVFASLELDTIISKNLTFTYEVILNTLYFQPESVTSGRIISNRLNQSLRTLRIESNLSGLDNRLTKLNTIKGLVLVGSAKKGFLGFGEILISDSTFYPEKKDGALSIEGVCQHSLNELEFSSGTEVFLNSNIIQDELNFLIKTNEAGSFQFILFDLNGKVIYKSMWSKHSKSSNIEEEIFNFDFSNRPSGYYLLLVKTPGRAIGKSIIKIK